MIQVKPNTAKRTAPNQKRSQQTLDRILVAAADLLEEVGFERLSTNLICKRAGLTPPALYRYFPNKYAVLKELGERLMIRQNELLEEWQFDPEDLSGLTAQIEVFLAATIDVTRATKAGGWIMRSMHASPILSDVRLGSHRRVAQQLADRILAAWPTLDPARVFQSTRLGVEMGYALVEMVFDETRIDESEMISMTAAMLTQNFERLLAERA